jgi:hypothetical protein
MLLFYNSDMINKFKSYIKDYTHGYINKNVFKNQCLFKKRFISKYIIKSIVIYESI